MPVPCWRGLLAACSLLAGGLACPAAPSPTPPQVRPSPLPRDSGALTLEVIPERLYAAPLLTLRGPIFQVLFHVNFQNRTSRPLRIRRVQFIGLMRGRVLLRRELAEILLAHELHPAPLILMKDRQTMAAAHRWQGELRRSKGDTIILRGGRLSLTHQLFLTRPDSIFDHLRLIVEHDLGRTELCIQVHTFRQRTTLRLPFANPWWVMAGHRYDEYHSDGLLTSQAHAYDFGVLVDGLSTYQGDRLQNQSYHAHGRPILAAADGVVAQVQDGVEDNVPVGTRPSWESLLPHPRSLAGNYVVLDHGHGEHTAYLHLRIGVPLSPGARVKAGDVVGYCGNSGNSAEPHLHFQLQDGPDPLQASGMPAVFADWTMYMARLRFHVPATRPQPLPSWLVVQPGRAEGAVELVY